MKVPFILSTLVTAAALAQEPIPTGFGKDRYEEMFASSPFVLATPPETKDDAPKDSPFNNVYITSMSLARDGRTVVYIKRPGDDQGIKLVGEEAHESGFTLTKVNWGDGWKNATVVAKHTNGETKELKFNEFQQVAAAMPPQGGPGGRGPGGRAMLGGPQPGGPTAVVPGGAAASGNPAVPVPKVGGPSPTVPRPSAMAVPRPGGGATLPAGTPGQGTYSPVTGESRTRVRGQIGNGASGNNNGGGRNNGGGNGFNRR